MEDFLKILHVIPTLGKGGAERLLLDICRETLRTGKAEVQVAVLSSGSAYPFTEELSVHYDMGSITLSPLRKNKADTDRLEALINSFRPDVIHSHAFYADLVSRYNLRKDVRYVSHIHGRTSQYEKFPAHGLFHKRSWTDAYEKRFIFKKYRECDNRFLTVSDHYKKYLESKAGIPEKLITVLPNAIDHEIFKPGDRIFSGGTLRLITIGRLEKVKGQELLVHVTGELKRLNINAHLYILGEGSERRNLESLIRSLDLQDSVSLTGNVNAPEKYLAESDIYIHGAVDEPFGLSLVEAMACGLPVVSTNGGGNSELLEDGINGFLINSRDVQAFTDKVIKLAENRQLYTRIRENGMAYAAQFNIRDYVAALHTFYYSILA